MGKLLTIVIAAYNKEDLLPRCLDSLQVSSEMMKKVQVLVVNDGSKDRTLEVAKEYEQKYPEYFHVIDKENGNYGSVMNTALPLAMGKYFRTLDADDWYDTNSYIKFIKALENTDAEMIITEGFKYDEKKKLLKYCQFGDIIEGKDIPISQAFADLSMFNGCLNVPFFTFKTSTIRKSGLKWIEGIFYTDTMFDVWPLPYVENVRLERLPVYVYVEGLDDQSMAIGNTIKNVNHFTLISEELIPYFIKHYDKDAVYTKLMKYFLYQLLMFIYRNMWINDDCNEIIRKTHHLLDPVPDVQHEFERAYRYRGIDCLKDIVDGKETRTFKIVRELRKVSQGIKRFLGIQK